MEEKSEGWGRLLQKMDGAGQLAKVLRRQKKGAPKPEPVKKVGPEVGDVSEAWIYAMRHKDILPYFDGSLHGYCRCRNRLLYKFPDGTYQPATGVDEFGPFEDNPRKGWEWGPKKA